jgi:hypothetical protein
MIDTSRDITKSLLEVNHSVREMVERFMVIKFASAKCLLCRHNEAQEFPGCLGSSVTPILQTKQTFHGALMTQMEVVISYRIANM